jgi:DNA-binding response OmpR family regulator
MHPARPRSRILVVDDDLGSRTLAAIVLTEAGYSPICVPTVERALARLAQDGADLVLTDLMMPRLGGVDLMRALRTSTDAPPVLAMTSSDDEVLISEALDLGAAGVLRKPVPPERLVAMVDRVLGPRRSVAA